MPKFKMPSFGVSAPSKAVEAAVDVPDWASLELSPSVESCGCGLGPSPVRLGEVKGFGGGRRRSAQSSVEKWRLLGSLVQTRDPCRPWRATLDPGHKPR